MIGARDNAITYVVAVNRLVADGTRFTHPACAIVASTHQADQAVANPALIAGPNGETLLLYEYDVMVERQVIKTRIMHARPGNLR